MSTAKTTAERQADLKARRQEAGLRSLKNVWVHPDDVAAMREHAEKLAHKRQRVGKKLQAYMALVLKEEV